MGEKFYKKKKSIDDANYRLLNSFFLFAYMTNFSFEVNFTLHIAVTFKLDIDDIIHYSIKGLEHEISLCFFLRENDKIVERKPN